MSMYVCKYMYSETSLVSLNHNRSLVQYSSTSLHTYDNDSVITEYDNHTKQYYSIEPNIPLSLTILPNHIITQAINNMHKRDETN